MQMSEKMHDESGEAERRRAREGERLPGWVCGCQTKTSGGQVENTDYTEWSAGVKERRGPEHRWKDLRPVQSVVQKWKRLFGGGSAVTEASLPSAVTLAGWLTLPSTVGGSIWLLAHLYTRFPTYRLPPTHCISYTHIDKGAAKLMLMWPLGCTCTALTLSAGEQTDELLVAVVNFPPPTMAPITICITLHGHASSHCTHFHCSTVALLWKPQCLTDYRLTSNCGIWKILGSDSTQIIF